MIELINVVIPAIIFAKYNKINIFDSSFPLIHIYQNKVTLKSI